MAALFNFSDRVVLKAGAEVGEITVFRIINILVKHFMNEDGEVVEDVVYHTSHGNYAESLLLSLEQAVPLARVALLKRIDDYEKLLLP